MIFDFFFWKNFRSPLYLHTVSFGGDSQSYSLDEMAKIAHAYHSSNASTGTLRCQFIRAVDENNLVNYFISIAESLKKHRM